MLMDFSSRGDVGAAAYGAAAMQPPGLSGSPRSDGSDIAAAAAALLAASADEQPRKLAVLGLPWETCEDTLRLHFGQYGVVEAAEVMKDRFSGKSRGFGFVTYVDSSAAQRALCVDHIIDGRRCEAKVALPKTLLQAEPLVARTTRIFVARIPAAVNEAQFRAYFERFGKLQDAYMPRDHSKQAYRGIGFVTFASPDSVEKVMACKHWMNGHEVAIDRATPKDEPSSGRPSGQFSRCTAPLHASSQRRSFDNGAGIIGPGLTPVTSFAAQSAAQLSGFGAEPATSTIGGLCSLPEDGGLPDAASAAYGDAAAAAGFSGALGLSALSAGAGGSCGPKATSSAGQLAALHNLAKAHAALSGLQLGGAHAPTMSHQLGALPAFLNPSLASLSGLDLAALSGALCQLNASAGAAPPPPPPLAAPPPGAGRKSLDSALHSLAAASAQAGASHKQCRSENPVIASARAGPRIFLGKLTKDTTEADVKEYFSRFGYVMDVYMPKAKDNKAEHRGFGFVTFETDAAIKRVVGAGAHRLKGSTIAIDIAMPKVDDDGAGAAALDGSGAGSLGGSQFVGGLGPGAFDAAAAVAAAARHFQGSLPMAM